MEQKDETLPTCGLGSSKGSLYPQELALVDWRIVSCKRTVARTKPTAAAADSIRACRGKRIVQKSQLVANCFIHFAERLPPVVMIAAD